jgi:hypothetical protein
MDRVPVLNVKEIDPLAKDIRFIVSFDPKSLSCVGSAKACLKFFDKLLRQIRRWPQVGFHFSALLYLKIHLKSGAAAFRWLAGSSSPFNPSLAAWPSSRARKIKRMVAKPLKMSAHVH